ncbi:hypothetical protein K504DRAFT_508961 [Pleomassaria siparia CBS 279.74]|uniref:Uncharacterized protein n=1 Tax=Pleomassaria siparia CBS 279.74 TaxID=1314801 RepID=A0A6G1JPL9_9PLEO|nr:hypothetical protein K504DRAFT_508961 [Pleomassaria siparia CBS 279.74]
MATFAPPPRQYPCWVLIDEIRTSVWGILLGLNVNSYEVWGHVPRTSARCFASDAPGRAIMWLATVEDLWAKTGTQTVRLISPPTLDLIAHWDAGIKGNTLEERYAFAYDAVVKEAKRITT